MQHLDDQNYQIIWLVRRLFRALAQKSTDNLQDLGISAADRAVMEFLYPDASLSVPELASKYQVSRQHVQVTVNGLLEKGLVSTEDNPRHKRSPLIKLSESGIALFQQIAERDQHAIDALFRDIPESDIVITLQTLQSLKEKMS